MKTRNQLEAERNNYQNKVNAKYKRDAFLLLCGTSSIIIFMLTTAVCIQDVAEFIDNLSPAIMSMIVLAFIGIIVFIKYARK